MSPEWREGANFTSSVSPVFKSRNCKYIFRFPLSRDRPRVPCRPGPEYCFCLILLDRHTRTVCCVVVCVCVVISFILDVRLVDVPAGATQEEGHRGFLIHLFLQRRLPLFFSREGFSRSFPSSTVEPNSVS